jgi:hypothetical protein
MDVDIGLSGTTKAHPDNGYAATREAAMTAFAKSWRLFVSVQKHLRRHEEGSNESIGCRGIVSVGSHLFC